MFNTFPAWIQVWAKWQWGPSFDPRNPDMLAAMARVEIHEMAREAHNYLRLFG